jgi:hypothetical protein
MLLGYKEFLWMHWKTPDREDDLAEMVPENGIHLPWMFVKVLFSARLVLKHPIFFSQKT